MDTLFLALQLTINDVMGLLWVAALSLGFLILCFIEKAINWFCDAWDNWWDNLFQDYYTDE